MTAIAEHAQASIGTLYDYFPDKPALALVLITQYTHEAEAHWAKFLQRPLSRGKASIADAFIEGILEFVRDRPAYLPLFGAPLGYARSKADREPLRRTIATALQNLKPGLTTDRAFLKAQVIVEIIKGMLSVYRQATPTDREGIVDEFKNVMRLYFTDTLG